MNYFESTPETIQKAYRPDGGISNIDVTQANAHKLFRLNLIQYLKLRRSKRNKEREARKSEKSFSHQGRPLS